MSAIPTYLARARAAIARSSEPPAPSTTDDLSCETSERSEESRLQPGSRYRVNGAAVGIVHASPPDFERWREALGFPRAGIMTIEGELVVVTDVTLAMKSGWVDILAVPATMATGGK